MLADPAPLYSPCFAIQHLGNVPTILGMEGLEVQFL